MPDNLTAPPEAGPPWADMRSLRSEGNNDLKYHDTVALVIFFLRLFLKIFHGVQHPVSIDKPHNRSE